MSSGIAALIYETIWIRWFKILFGSTAYAASATLAAFFAGLTIGAALFARVSQTSRRPLHLYVALELGIIATALIVPYTVDAYDLIYPVLYEQLDGNEGTFVATKFLLAFFAMLPTTLLLGGTLPLLVRSIVHKHATIGRDGNRLYAFNTGGAMIGSALGGLILPELIGISNTYTFGIILTLLAGIAAWFVAGYTKVPPPVPSASNTKVRLPRFLLIIAWASGFGTLAVEVLLMHALSQLFDSSVYSFGAILIVILAALTLGATVISYLSSRYSVRSILQAVLLAEALLLVTLPWIITQTLSHYGAVTSTLTNGLLFSVLIGGPAFFVGGLVLPLTFRLAEGDAPGRRFGELLSLNTLGGIIGSVVAGFILLKAIGLWSSLALVGLAYALASILVADTTRNRVTIVSSVFVAFTLLLLVPLNPWKLPRVLLNENEDLIAYREGAHGVVSVVTRPILNDYRIKINNHYTLSGSGARTAVERGGHLPLLLHPAPRRVAFIGSATGITAGAAVFHPVEQIDLIELVPEVQELAAEYFGKFNREIYNDPRRRIIVEDGRNHIRATTERYDVVVADLFVPWRPGVGNMYSLDHFQSVSEHLSKGGIFCQWLPIFQLRSNELGMILRTFYTTFPNATLWRGNFSGSLPRMAACGTNEEWATPADIERRVFSLAGRINDRWVTDPKAFWMMYAGPLRTLIDSGPINTDDLPLFEFLAARSSAAARERFLQGEWLTLSAKLGAGYPQDDNSGWPNWGREPGHLFTEVSALYVRNRQKPDNDTARLLNQQRRKLKSLLPEHLYKPDPTVSEMKSL